MDQKKIILFGCGEIGFRLLQYFGKNQVFAFCDNSCSQRTTKYEVDLIPYNELKENLNNHILIVSVNPQNAGEIVDQLMGDDIKDFLVYDSVLNSEMKCTTPEKFMSIIADDYERLGRERDYLYRYLNYKNEQLSFLESISDIHKLNPAKGNINAVKRELKEYVKEVFDYLSELKIKPFTAAGTAIGLYRHGGFIPWDDDVDFGLFRQDYMKLIQYGKNHMPFIEIALGVEGDRLQAEYFRKYPNEYIMMISPNCLQIKKGTSWIDANTIDFFPYDFYEEDFSYEKHLENIKECGAWRRYETGTKKITDFIENYGHTCDESPIISFGLDGMDPYVCPKGGWINRDVMLPLREVQFEGISCYAPNDIKAYLSYCYRDFEGYPSDIGALHGADRAEIMKSFYICMMIIVEDENFEKFIKLYQKLRVNGINCVYLFSRKYLATKTDYEKIKKKVIDAEIQYTNEFDSDYDCVIASDRVRKKLNYNKVVYDSAQKPDDIFNEFIKDISDKTFNQDKIKMCLL